MKNLFLNLCMALGLLVITTQTALASGPMQPKIVTDLSTTNDVFECTDCTAGMSEYILVMYSSAARSEIFKMFYWNTIIEDLQELAVFDTEYLNSGGLSGLSGKLMFPDAEIFLNFNIIDELALMIKYNDGTSDLYDYFGNFEE